jgi:hypothetical protein
MPHTYLRAASGWTAPSESGAHGHAGSPRGEKYVSGRWRIVGRNGRVWDGEGEQPHPIHNLIRFTTSSDSQPHPIHILIRFTTSSDSQPHPIHNLIRFTSSSDSQPHPIHILIRFTSSSDSQPHPIHILIRFTTSSDSQPHPIHNLIRFTSSSDSQPHPILILIRFSSSSDSHPHPVGEAVRRWGMQGRGRSSFRIRGMESTSGSSPQRRKGLSRQAAPDVCGLGVRV